MDAVNVLTVGLNNWFKFVKSGYPILNKCFQGHGSRRFVGAQLIRGGPCWYVHCASIAASVRTTWILFEGRLLKTSATDVMRHWYDRVVVVQESAGLQHSGHAVPVLLLYGLESLPKATC